ncbi:MAG: ABC transporter permease [Calditrichaeota bacterium]|nr:ABC transporter permease [Calditrichota bacterium]
MRKILALAFKDLRLLFRDKSGLAFTLFLPLMFALFFGMMYSTDSGPEAVPIALVDQDSTAASRAFVARLDSSTELEVHQVADTSAGRELVRKRRCVALVVLPPGFGAQQQNPFAQGPPRILLGFDPAQSATAGMVEGILMKYAAEDLSNLFANPGEFRTSIRASLDSVRKSTSLPAPRKQSLISFLSELDRFLAEEDTSASKPMQGFEPLKVETLEIVNPSQVGAAQLVRCHFPPGHRVRHHRRAVGL